MMADLNSGWTASSAAIQIDSIIEAVSCANLNLLSQIRLDLECVGGGIEQRRRGNDYTPKSLCFCPPGL